MQKGQTQKPFFDGLIILSLNGENEMNDIENIELFQSINYSNLGMQIKTQKASMRIEIHH